MQVTMRTSSAGPAGALHAGRTYDLADDEAKQLIAGGYATPVDRSTKTGQAERAVAESTPAVRTPIAPVPAARKGGPKA